MTIYPAIDLRNGRCVRLFQGKADQETVYYQNPAEPARSWKDAGADHLHVVDLDGAFAGASANLVAVRSILQVEGLKVQLGGRGKGGRSQTDGSRRRLLRGGCLGQLSCDLGDKRFAHSHARRSY